MGKLIEALFLIELLLCWFLIFWRRFATRQQIKNLDQYFWKGVSISKFLRQSRPPPIGNCRTTEIKHCSTLTLLPQPPNNPIYEQSFFFFFFFFFWLTGNPAAEGTGYFLTGLGVFCLVILPLARPLVPNHKKKKKKSFFLTCGHAATIWPKTSTAAKFLYLNSHFPFETRLFLSINWNNEKKDY